MEYYTFDDLDLSLQDYFTSPIVTGAVNMRCNDDATVRQAPADEKDKLIDHLMKELEELQDRYFKELNIRDKKLNELRNVKDKLISEIEEFETKLKNVENALRLACKNLLKFNNKNDGKHSVEDMFNAYIANGRWSK